MSATWPLLLIAAGGAGLLVAVVRSLWRMDEERRRRPHPGPDQGGDRFGDTTHWGGWGRPGQ